VTLQREDVIGKGDEEDYTVVIMKPFSKKCIEIELHTLELPFTCVRISKKTYLHSLTDLLEQQGQQVPVVVVASQHTYLLIDGYLRIQALKRLGKDTVLAEVWSCSPDEGLLHLLAGKQARPYEAVEEAMVLQALQLRYHLSQEKIAHRIGRDQSWVSRRLALIHDLPDEVCQAVMKGVISSWSANRVLVPMARAMHEHATQFVAYLVKNTHTTREVSLFYQHYLRSSRKVRQHMVNEPALFFKTIRHSNHDDKSPEHQWITILNRCQQMLQGLIPFIPQIFYQAQPEGEQKKLINTWRACQQTFVSLNQQLRSLDDVRTTITPDDSQSPSKRQESA